MLKQEEFHRLDRVIDEVFIYLYNLCLFISSGETNNRERAEDHEFQREVSAEDRVVDDERRTKGISQEFHRRCWKIL